MIRQAYQFATIAHHGQYRKYTREPYIMHLIRVTALVKKVVDDESVICAAMLLDTIKHAEYLYEDIERVFGERIATLVSQVTTDCIVNDSEAKKRQVRDQLKRASTEAKTIKLASIIDHAHTIFEHDDRLAQDYVRDQMVFIDALDGGHKTLFIEAKAVMKHYIDDIANTRFELTQRTSS